MIKNVLFYWSWYEKTTFLVYMYINFGSVIFLQDSMEICCVAIFKNVKIWQISMNQSCYAHNK